VVNTSYLLLDLWILMMSENENHVENLKKIRSNLVQARRKIAGDVAPNLYNTSMRLQEYQELVEAIDRAIEDEKRIQISEDL
jgi:hypothetical protein